MSSTAPAAKRVATVLLLVALSLVAALAFVSTFPAAYYAAETIGLPTYAAVSWALLPDAGTLVGMLGALVLTDRRGRRFAILSVIVFGLSSALVNVAHAIADRMGTPPVGLLVAYGATATIALVLSAETASRVVVSLVPAVEAKPVPKVEKEPAEKGSNLPPRRDDTTVIAQAREVARKYAREGKRLTVSALQAECRLSWKRAARVHAEVTA
ncbi:hypothetical protein BU52_10725 [Streptomyces toyocaensis]|uniref:Uncharacterized protein n=1 Tax=Streptomyces toyocaensis TaxID=55952 RepID=A0A081XU40_STRTO|nr:hypothetical protein [Streptomyces toyocaensis]KES07063.1 hypothetical protein BU52_10725 [Streptomyces toyocaensis]